MLRSEALLRRVVTSQAFNPIEADKYGKGQVMNVFKKLFYKDKTEKELEEKYLSVFFAAGFSLADAKKIFHDVLKIIKQESQKEGTNNWPEKNGGQAFVHRIEN